MSCLPNRDPTRDELVSMVAEVRQAVDHAERLIDALLVLARNEQARVLNDPLDLATIAEDALEGRTATGVTMISTLNEAPVTGDAVLLERLVANLLDNAERYNIDGGTVSICDQHRQWCVHDARDQHRRGRTSRPTRPAVPAVHTARRPNSPPRFRPRARPGVIDRQASTTAPSTPPPTPPADSTSAFASPAATTGSRTITTGLKSPR